MIHRPQEPAFRRTWRWLTVVAFAAVAIGLLVACEGDSDDAGDEPASALDISNARAQFTTTDLGAVYFDIRSTSTGDVLLAATADIADDTQIHEVVTGGGSAMMRPVEGGIPIDPGGHVSLEPGGYHVMLLGVDEIPEVGSTFEVVLEFENAGRMTVTVHVQEFGAEGEDGQHGSMGDGEMDGEGTGHE